MKNDKKKKGGPKDQIVDPNYNPANRDFQRTEEDLDDVSKSEKEELEKRKERVHDASTTPDKDHVGS
jgi:hypothetical protein